MSNLDFSAIRINGTLPDPDQIDISQLVSDLWEPYLDSVTSLLGDLECAALALEEGNAVEDNSAAIRRILHSIKGDSGMSGLMDIYNLCHEAEYAFEELPTCTVKADMCLRVKDWIDAAIRMIKNGGSEQVIEDVDSTGMTHKIKTLIIDDEHVCRESVRRIVEPYCDCTYAVNGAQGFELFKQAHQSGDIYRLVLLDIQMPEMNGHETLAAIRQYEQKSGIVGLDGVKVIMTTSLEESRHVFSAFREGCEAYVIKNQVEEKLPAEMANLGLLKTSMKYTL